MDDVFSPIAGDFKRMAVGRFDNEEEAEDCVLKPLLSIGVENPRRLFSEETLSDLVNPRGLTGASPYQIQPACHFIFKDMQIRGSNRMELTVDVLDGVLNEIVGGGIDIRNSRVIGSSAASIDSRFKRWTAFVWETDTRMLMS